MSVYIYTYNKTASCDDCKTRSAVMSRVFLKMDTGCIERLFINRDRDFRGIYSQECVRHSGSNNMY